MAYTNYIKRCLVFNVRKIPKKKSALCCATRFWMKIFSRWTELTENLLVSGSGGTELM